MWDEFKRLPLTLLIGAVVFAVWFMFSGCVRNVTICATYDRRLGRESTERYARSSTGASVCADVSPAGAE